MKGEKVEVDRKLPLNLLTLGEDEVPGAFEYKRPWWKYCGWWVGILSAVGGMYQN